VAGTLELLELTGDAGVEEDEVGIEITEDKLLEVAGDTGVDEEDIGIETTGDELADGEQSGPPYAQ
jgi:hypothetical protein